jgi:hypothetical protein
MPAMDSPPSKQMVFAYLANRACLRAFLPDLLNEANLGADPQAIEAVVKDAVAI